MMVLEISLKIETVKMNMLQQDTDCKMRNPQRKSRILLDSCHKTSNLQTKKKFLQGRRVEKFEWTVLLRAE